MEQMAMADVGVDISAHTSDHVDQRAERDFDLVLKVCDSAREASPISPGATRTLHQAFGKPDRPSLGDGELYALFTRIRDETGDYARQLLTEELGALGGHGLAAAAHLVGEPRQQPREPARHFDVRGSGRCCGTRAGAGSLPVGPGIQQRCCRRQPWYPGLHQRSWWAP